MKTMGVLVLLFALLTKGASLLSHDGDWMDGGMSNRRIIIDGVQPRQTELTRGRRFILGSSVIITYSPDL